MDHDYTDPPDWSVLVKTIVVATVIIAVMIVIMIVVDTANAQKPADWCREEYNGESFKLLMSHAILDDDGDIRRKVNVMGDCVADGLIFEASHYSNWKDGLIMLLIKSRYMSPPPVCVLTLYFREQNPRKIIELLEPVDDMLFLSAGANSIHIIAVNRDHKIVRHDLNPQKADVHFSEKTPDPAVLSEKFPPPPPPGNITAAPDTGETDPAPEPEPKPQPAALSVDGWTPTDRADGQN